MLGYWGWPYSAVTLKTGPYVITIVINETTFIVDPLSSTPVSWPAPARRVVRDVLRAAADMLEDSDG